MGATEYLSCTQGTTDFNPSTFTALWRSDMPIHGHIMHHTEANKSHKFSATGHGPTKLEEWLMDLQTATKLTNESHAELV